jgi:hypothetical protein
LFVLGWDNCQKTTNLLSLSLIHDAANDVPNLRTLKKDNNNLRAYFRCNYCR